VSCWLVIVGVGYYLQTAQLLEITGDYWKLLEITGDY